MGRRPGDRSEAEGGGPAPRKRGASGGAHRGIENGGRGGICRKTPAGSAVGPQVMVGVRNLMIDECSFSGKTSLAAGNHHEVCQPENPVELVLPPMEKETALGRWSQDLSVASSAG